MSKTQAHISTYIKCTYAYRHMIHDTKTTGKPTILHSNSHGFVIKTHN